MWIEKQARAKLSVFEDEDGDWKWMMQVRRMGNCPVVGVMLSVQHYTTRRSAIASALTTADCCHFDIENEWDGWKYVV